MSPSNISPTETKLSLNFGISGKNIKSRPKVNNSILKRPESLLIEKIDFRKKENEVIRDDIGDYNYNGIQQNKTDELGTKLRQITNDFKRKQDELTLMSLDNERLNTKITYLEKLLIDKHKMEEASRFIKAELELVKRLNFSFETLIKKQAAYIRV